MTIPSLTSQASSGSIKRKISATLRGDLSPSLNNIRHDHPLVSFEMSFLPNSPSNSSCYESRPISDFDAKHPCLPYAFYYDTDELTDDTDEGFLPKSTTCDPDDEWMLLGDSPPITMTTTCYGVHPLDCSSFTGKKDGPTLAQLNFGNECWDSDDLVSIGNIQFDRSIKRKLSQTRIDRTDSAKKKRSHQQKTEEPLTQQAIKSDQNELSREASQDLNPSTNLEVDKKEAIYVKEELHKDLPESVKTVSKIPVEIKSIINEVIEEAPVASTSKMQTRPKRPDVARVRNTSEGSISSHDEGFGSQPEDSDDDDVDSDDESFYGDYDAKDLLGASTCDDENNKWSLNMGRTRKGGQQRFFWQYNVQSKGPKGIRIPSMAESPVDPHVLSEAKDPVFSPECRVEGVKHAGKARRGDGNDLTPNPRKLLMIGLELKKLSKIINDLTPVSDVPVTARNKTRKEKNKLASRACRLKKKAQHEANKIKLFGLNQEHKKTIALMADIKKMTKKRLETRNSSPLTPLFKEALKQHEPLTPVAGRTADFVNSVSLLF
jgi:hypothetical protein